MSHIFPYRAREANRQQYSSSINSGIMNPRIIYRFPNAYLHKSDKPVDFADGENC